MESRLDSDKANERRRITVSTVAIDGSERVPMLLPFVDETLSGSTFKPKTERRQARSGPPNGDRQRHDQRFAANDLQSNPACASFAPTCQKRASVLRVMEAAFTGRGTRNQCNDSEALESMVCQRVRLCPLRESHPVAAVAQCRMRRVSSSLTTTPLFTIC
jgi:hypothetical protein